MKERFKLLLLKFKSLWLKFKLLLLKIVGILKMYWIYIVIMFVSVLVRAIPFSSGNLSLDGTINDIAIGAFASTLVAWLIYLQDQSQIKKKNEKLRKYEIKPFFESLMNYLQSFCNFVSLYDDRLKDSKKTFLEWNNLYFTQIVELQDKPASNLKPMNIKFLSSIVGQIKKNSRDIVNDSIWLQKEGILSKSECDLIEDIGFYCRALELFMNGNTNEHAVKILNEGFCDTLQKNPGWKELVETPYSSNTLLSECIKRKKAKK